MSKVGQDFPNEPDKREDLVSYSFVNTVDIHKETGTSTDLKTGDVHEIDNLNKVKMLFRTTFYLFNTSQPVTAADDPCLWS